MANNNLAVRKGLCINSGQCSKAIPVGAKLGTKGLKNYIIEVNSLIGDDFICPECEQALIDVKTTTWWEKSKKWILPLIVVLAMGGVGYGIYWLITKDPKPEPVVLIKPENATVKVGDTVKLTIKTEPENSSEKMKWNWASSDENVATVSRNGVVMGANEGNTTITVTSDKNLSATAFVTVTPDTVLVESVSFDQPSLSLKVGDTITIRPIVSPDNATNKELVWSSSDESVAKFDNGKVNALKKGHVVITAKSIDGSEKSAVLNVTVTDGDRTKTPQPPQPVTELTYSCGVYKGETSNRKAQGLGTLTYKARTLIDDAKLIYAERGDYITGTFRDDKIVSVRLFDSGGNLKQTVIPQQPTSICR